MRSSVVGSTESKCVTGVKWFSNDSRHGCTPHPPHIPLLGNTVECNRSMSHDYPSSHSPNHPTHPFLAIPSFWLDVEEEHGKPTKVIMSTIRLLKSRSVLVCGLWFVDNKWCKWIAILLLLFLKLLLFFVHVIENWIFFIFIEDFLLHDWAWNCHVQLYYVVLKTHYYYCYY